MIEDVWSYLTAQVQVQTISQEWVLASLLSVIATLVGVIVYLYRAQQADMRTKDDELKRLLEIMRIREQEQASLLFASVQEFTKKLIEVKITVDRLEHEHEYGVQNVPKLRAGG